ncbi:hypothetical protein WR25_17639 isoform B [Diploscapter pachys]|uniref:Rho-GAP domain-containing protein n=1 Tax=Diploscapter pachys TaxID=2018661 RepID=A0A2A2LC78_9BILA|nr:hypothetical protein WR25_17639 isoform B [Diploscapter pachys]
MLDEPSCGEKKKSKGIKLVSRKSTKKILGKWKKLESQEKSDVEGNDSEIERTPFCERVFGLIPREAVQADPSLDGIPIPAFFRTSIDFIESNALDLEGIYRVSSPKSRLDELEKRANEGQSLRFFDGHEPAGLIKRFLRQLPRCLLTGEFESIVDACHCDWKHPCRCEVVNLMKEKLKALPKEDYFLLGYTIIHAQHIIDKESSNKMSVHALGLLLQTVLEMSRKLVCYLLVNAAPASFCENRDIPADQNNYLFDGMRIAPYVRPKPASQIEDWKCDDGPMIEEELKKQQALLNVLHQQITIRRESGHETKHLEDQLWGVQTAITALKRRFKASSEPVPPIKAADGGTRPCREMFEEKQLMATKSQLREELMEERRNIARCLWKLEMADEDWKSLNRPRSQQNKSAIEREIDEWKEKSANFRKLDKQNTI